MDYQAGKGVGKGSDDNLREYRVRSERRKIIRKIIVPFSALFLILMVLIIILTVGFRVKTIHVKGLSSYTVEEVVSRSGVSVGDHMMKLSQGDIEAALKSAFPFIHSVTVHKNYPSELVLEIKEEYTTFCYESEGECFLFNRDLRLMGKYDSLESLMALRKAIVVEIPLPESSIVPQYIQMDDENEYVKTAIYLLSESEIASQVTSFDMRDPYVLRMKCGKDVWVELGDSSNLESKFSALVSLLGENGGKMTGRVDLTAYPRCFYDLRQD